ncbi:hypothetical protein ACHAWF_009881 [Thalassiosira exigua]
MQCLELADDRDRASELFVDHKAEDAHHGSAAVVELDSALLELGLLIEGVPAEVDVAVAEVTNELSGGSTVSGVLHDEELKEANEDKHLASSGSRDGVGAADGRETVGVGVEGVSSPVDGSGEVVSGAGGDLAKEGKLGDAAVLDLNVTEAVESLLVGIVKEAEGIVEAERGLGAELALEGVEGGGGLAGGGRGEGGGRGDGGGEDDRLHGYD